MTCVEHLREACVECRIKRLSSPQFKTLLETSWDEDPANRPLFETICETIRNHLSQSDSRKCRMDSPGNTGLMTSSQGRRSSLGNMDLMTSRQSIHTHQDSERCFPLYRKVRETRAIDQPKCNQLVSTLSVQALSAGISSGSE